MVVWSSSSGRPARHRVREIKRSARRGPIRRWLRTGLLLAIIGAIRLARTVRARPRPTLLPAGTVITVVGIALPSEAVLVSGVLVLLVALFLPFDPDVEPAGR